MPPPGDNPPFEWQTPQSEGDAPDEVNYVGPPGFSNELLLEQLKDAVRRFYRCSVTHRCLSADMVDGLHATQIVTVLDIAGLTSATPASGDLFIFADISDSDAVRKATLAVINAALDHGTLAGLGDDDHSIYLLASAAGGRATFATNWTDLTDAGATTLHKHDHGGMDGLADDDHTQYMLDAGTSVDNTIPRFNGTDGRTMQTSDLQVGDIASNEIIVSPVTADTPTKLRIQGGTDTTAGDNGADVELRGGLSSSGTAGNTIIRAGQSITGTDGAIQIGVTGGTAITIGRSGITTEIVDSVKVSQGTVGNVQVDLISTATNDDPRTRQRQARAATTADGTTTTLHTFSLATAGTYMIKVRVMGRLTAQDSSTPTANVGDSVGYEMFAVFSNLAGTVTQVGTTDQVAKEHANLTGANATFSISGTNVLLQVTTPVVGDAEDGAMVWHMPWGWLDGQMNS